MTRRASTRLLHIARQVEALAYLYPDAIEHLHARADAIDGYPRKSVGAGPPTGGHRDDPDADVELTTTEAAAATRERYVNWRLDLEAGVNLLDVTVKDLAETSHRALRGAVTIEGPKLCNPFGRDGALEWSDPTCREAATKLGLCPRHYMAERRWRERNGYPPREAAA